MAFNFFGKLDNYYVNIPPPPQLFHYTNGAGFLGILQTKELWATDTRFLNDRQELLYAKNLISSELELCSEVTNWNPYFNTLDVDRSLAHDLKTEFDKLKILPDVYVASFSTKPDSLSQWREYGRYNIGISGRALKTCANRAKAILARCIYLKDYQDKWATRFVTALLTAYRKDPKHKPWHVMLECFCRYGPLLKHPSFEEEAEWRIIIPELSSLEFRQSNHVVVPYLKIYIGSTFQAQPILQTGLGPGNDNLTERSVRRFTENLGFEVSVHRSDTPYIQD